MDRTELILTFIADIIHYIAWPAVVITMFVLVRHPIKTLIDKITKIIFKNRDTEVTFDLMEAFEASTEKDLDAMLLAEVTPDNLNWPTFANIANNLQLFALMYLTVVPLDAVSGVHPVIRTGMPLLEDLPPLMRKHLSVDQLAARQRAAADIRKRLAPILDNPS